MLENSKISYAWMLCLGTNFKNLINVIYKYSKLSVEYRLLENK